MSDSKNTAMNNTINKRKTRLIVKNSHENIILIISDIALFYIEERSVFVIDRNGKKFCFQKSLSEIEEELDPELFFRANRRMIVNINYIKSFSEYDRNKIKVDLTVSHPVSPIIISQETAPCFKTWLCESWLIIQTFIFWLFLQLHFPHFHLAFGYAIRQLL